MSLAYSQLSISLSAISHRFKKAFVYRLIHRVFIPKRGVQLPYALPTTTGGESPQSSINTPRFSNSVNLETDCRLPHIAPDVSSNEKSSFSLSASINDAFRRFFAREK